MMELRPYPEYKDSGADHLGKIPRHWMSKPLKHWVHMNENTLSETTNPDTIIQYIDIGSVGTGFLQEQPERIVFRDAPSRARRILRKNDTIISTVRTYLKAVYFVASDKESLIASTGFAVLTPRSGVNPRFLGYLVQCDSFVERVSANSVGASYPAIAPTKLGVLPLPIPPEAEEQRLIVRFLDAKTRLIDRFIRSKGRLIKLLQEQKQAVINDCVTGKMEVRRIVDENGNSSFRLQPSACKMRDSGIDWLGEIPEHWDIIPLRWNISISSGESIATERVSSEQSSNFPYFAVGGNGILGYTNVSNIHSITIVIGRVGALCGNVHLIESPAWITDNALRITRVDKFSHEYLSKQLEAMNLNRLANTSAQPLITGGMVKAQKVVLPPLEEQSMIIERCREVSILINNFISRAQRQIDLIQEYRTRLIADVVTGKVDVRGIGVEDVAED